MNMVISYERAKSFAEEHVDEIMKKIRNGKSKHKNCSPNELEWGFSWAVKVESISFKRLLNEIPKERPQTENEYLEDLLPRLIVSIYAKKERLYVSSSMLEVIPNEIKERYLKIFREEKEERDRFDALEASEQQKEIDDLLNQLRGSPGFMEVRIPK